MAELYSIWAKNLQRRVIEQQDRIALGEALRLYHANFFRSAYIYAWIVLAESIRGKIKVAADIGERPAQIIFTEVERLETAGQSVDKVLIDAAKSLSLIAVEDMPYVDSFWTKRCIFRAS